MKKHLTSLARKGMQIKTTLRFLSLQSENKKQQMLARMWRKRDPYTVLVGIKLVQPLCKSVWRLL
jgi:hypothetical protein